MVHFDFYVYEHIRNDDGSVFYVGKGRKNRAYIANRHHRSNWWMNINQKAGGFSVRFVKIDLSEEQAFELEISHIAFLRDQGVNICNISKGGDGASGFKRSAEWCEKMSAVHKGKIVSAEVRQKISESVKRSGYVHSEEVRKKISEAHKGHKRSLGYRHTDEWKKQASESRKGNKSRTGQKRSIEERAKASASLSGRIQGILTCPHCRKSGGNVMRRYHFDNCKVRDNANCAA